MGTYQKTKVIQSYLMMWASYDPIELGPLEPKNRGYIRTLGFVDLRTLIFVNFLKIQKKSAWKNMIELLCQKYR